MNNAQKMILVPVDKYERMQRQLTQQTDLPSVQTIGDEASRIDAQMHAVLDSANTKNEREKAIEFSQLLQKYLTQKGTFATNRLKRPRNDDYDDYDEDETENLNEGVQAEIKSIVRLFTKTYKNSAQTLLEHLVSSGKVAWNENRQLIYKTKTYHSMNIVDLISDCVKRKKPDARGLQFFITILGQINTPLSLIANAQVKNLLSKANISRSPSSSGFDKTPRGASTPNQTQRFSYSLTDDSTVNNSRDQTWSKLH